MSSRVLPTVDALRSLDEGWLDCELRLASVREQAALVRALMDQVERFADVPCQAPVAQLAEEMSRLGQSALAAASVFAGEPAARESAVVLAVGRAAH